MKKFINNLPKGAQTAVYVVLTILAIIILIRLYKWVKRAFIDPLNPDEVEGTSKNCNLTIFEERKVKKKADEIFNLVEGPNFLYYPEEINAIVSYSDCEIDLLHNYYLQTYGISILDHLNGEWDGGYYNPARKKLQNVLG